MIFLKIYHEPNEPSRTKGKLRSTGSCLFVVKKKDFLLD